MTHFGPFVTQLEVFLPAIFMFVVYRILPQVLSFILPSSFSLVVTWAFRIWFSHPLKLTLLRRSKGLPCVPLKSATEILAWSPRNFVFVRYCCRVTNLWTLSFVSRLAKTVASCVAVPSWDALELESLEFDSRTHIPKTHNKKKDISTIRLTIELKGNEFLLKRTKRNVLFIYYQPNFW